MREDKTSVETKAESGAALGVPPGRSNFAQKNASLPEEQTDNREITIQITHISPDNSFMIIAISIIFCNFAFIISK